MKLLGCCVTVTSRLLPPSSLTVSTAVRATSSCMSSQLRVTTLTPLLPCVTSGCSQAGTPRSVHAVLLVTEKVCCRAADAVASGAKVSSSVLTVSTAPPSVCVMVICWCRPPSLVSSSVAVRGWVVVFWPERMTSVPLPLPWWGCTVRSDHAP